MLPIRVVLESLQESKFPAPPKKREWELVYYGISLHVDGACPSFTDLRSGQTIKPEGYYGDRYQLLFDTVLLNKHPRETENQRQYRLSQYKPIQKDPFLRSIQTITGTVFQDGNYTIRCENQDDNDYIWGNSFSGRDIISYISDRFKTICNDPNGYFWVVPRKSRKEMDGLEKVNPDVRFIHSKDIVYLSDEEIVFMDGDKTAWLINNVGYFRFQLEGSTWVNVDSENGIDDGYYAHKLGYMPIVLAGGIRNDKGYYNSWLDSAKAWADEYVSAKSAENFVNKEASHPFIQVVSEECPDCSGIGKFQYCNAHLCPTSHNNCSCSSVEHFVEKSCGSCGGSGKRKRNPGDWIQAEASDMDKNLVKFINPDVSINKHHKETSEDVYEGIMRSLHLNYISEAQSAVAKDRDMETRYQFYSDISNDLFDRVIYQIVTYCLRLRNVKAEKSAIVPGDAKFSISKPFQFSIRTESEMLSELENGIKSGIPPYVRNKQVESYVDKRYGGDEFLIRKTYIINHTDVLAGYTSEECSSALLDGAISVDDYKFHVRLPNIIDRIAREKGKDFVLSSSIDDVYDLARSIFEAANPPQINIVLPDD